MRLPFSLGADALRRKVTMRSEWMFPTVLIALDVCAALVYAVKADWRMAVYWLAAATLTACVTYTGGAE